MLLDSLTRPLIIKDVIGSLDIEITNVAIDSRKVKRNGLFIALEGFTVDGHDFVQNAIENGAVAIVVNKKMPIPNNITMIVVENTREAMVHIGCKFYNNPTTKLKLIGITGTNGKTTTTNIIDFVLNDLGYSTGLIGTVENRIAGEKFESQNTTPESLELQELFHHMLKKKVSHVIMEVSSHGLELGRVNGCHFDIAGFTNLTQDHLDFHSTFEEYKKAKGRLFSQLSHESMSVLNGDDEAHKEYAKYTNSQKITYGIHNKSDVMAKNIKLTSKGMTFELDTFKGKKQVTTTLLGKFNVYNLLHAVSILLSIGFKLDDILPSIEKIKRIEGRMETVEEGQPFPVVVDFAHTPDALENVLKTVGEFTEGHIITVVGCGGNRDATKRPLMASITEKYSDLCIFTSDNPRLEEPDKILEDMLKGISNDKKVQVIENREEAIKFAISKAKKNDIVLIAGKGHENYQIIGKEKINFDDRLVAKKAIKERM